MCKENEKVHNIGTKNKQRKRCIKIEMKEGEKENKLKRTKIKEKGITLVALVITILFSYDEELKFSNSKGFLLQTI